MNNKNISYNKYLSRTETKLFVDLLQKGKTTFTIEDVSSITGLKEGSVHNFIYLLAKKGFASRLESGLYNIVPLELVDSGSYLGNEYLVAKELIRKKFKSNTPEYFISHGSAMTIHQMVTQPFLPVYCTSTKQVSNKNILGTDFRFINIKPELYFGYQNHWISDTEQVLLSDIERTILDGLKAPEHCGGLIEVAKGFWMKRNVINYENLVSYINRMDTSSVCGRLGFLLETYEIKNEILLDLLKEKINKSYALLDPNLTNEGNYLSKWKLRLNVSAEELKSIVRT